MLCGRPDMPTKTIFRILLMLALVLFAASTADAQRGGKGKKGKGKKAKGSGALVLPFPKAAPPVAADPFASFPKLGREISSGSAAKRGALLPAPVADEDEGLPEIPLFQGGNSFFWRDPRDPELQRYYFDVCDHDENEWISYREAAISLEVSREVFALYDTDRDGRIDRAEFGARFEQIVEKSGSYAPPRPAVAKPLTITSAEPGIDAESMLLIAAFDRDGDSILSPAEIDGLIALTGLPRSKIDVERVLSLTDSDGSRAVEFAELSGLRESLLVAAKKFGIDLNLDGSSRDSLSTLPGVIPQVTRLATPTPHFERLDQDGDGYLSTKDLNILQSPMHLSVRTNAVLAALDRDGDGRLSKEEFRTSFR